VGQASCRGRSRWRSLGCLRPIRRVVPTLELGPPPPPLGGPSHPGPTRPSRLGIRGVHRSGDGLEWALRCERGRGSLHDLMGGARRLPDGVQMGSDRGGRAGSLQVRLSAAAGSGAHMPVGGAAAHRAVSLGLGEFPTLSRVNPAQERTSPGAPHPFPVGLHAHRQALARGGGRRACQRGWGGPQFKRRSDVSLPRFC